MAAGWRRMNTRWHGWSRPGRRPPRSRCTTSAATARAAWMRIMGRPVRDADGRLVGGVVAMVDVDGERRGRRGAGGERGGVPRHLRAGRGRHRPCRAGRRLAAGQRPASAPSPAIRGRRCSASPSSRSPIPTTWPPTWRRSRRCWPARSTPIAMEKRYIRADGAVVWVNLTVAVAAGRGGPAGALHLGDRGHRRPQRGRGGAGRQRAALPHACSSAWRRASRCGRRCATPAGAIVDFRLLERNDAIDRVTGRLPAACIGRSLRTLFPDMPPHRFAALCAGGRDRRAAGAGGAGGRARPLAQHAVLPPGRRSGWRCWCAT